jgi:hypothetical protein
MADTRRRQLLAVDESDGNSRDCGEQNAAPMENGKGPLIGVHQKQLSQMGGYELNHK